MTSVNDCYIVVGLLWLTSAFGSPVIAEEIPVINNPSFENGKDVMVQGWMVHPGIEEVADRAVQIVADKAIDGEQAVKLKAGAQSRDSQWLLQDIAVNEDTKRQLVVRVQAKGIGSGQVHMIFYNAEGGTTGDHTEYRFFPIEDYLQYEWPLVIPPKTVKMRLHIGALGPMGAVTFDKVEILDAAKVQGAGPSGKEAAR